MTPKKSGAPLDHEALLEIVNGTSVETGEAFFDELVRHLARAIGKKNAHRGCRRVCHERSVSASSEITPALSCSFHAIMSASGRGI
jgi:hypothetical protein